MRYFLLSVPYNKQINFTFDALAGAEKTVAGLRDFRARLSEAKATPGLNEALHEATLLAAREFEEGMDDDLNTSVALAVHSQSDARREHRAWRERNCSEENKRRAARTAETLRHAF